MEDGRRYYIAELQKCFRAKLAKLNAPILIVQGEVGEGPVDRRRTRPEPIQR